MSLLALISQLGHALVSGGLGGPGDAPAEIVLPCPIVDVVATGRAVVRVTATGRATLSIESTALEAASVVATAREAVQVTAECP